MSPAQELPLRDIHLPPEPSWWPPAPGWWLLAILLLAAIVTGIVLLRRHVQQRRHRTRLLAEVDHIWSRHAGAEDGAAIVGDWSNLLRRACLRYQPALATREGLSWTNALGMQADGEWRPDQLLIEAPYRPRVSMPEAERLREAVRGALRRLIDGESIAAGGFVPGNADAAASEGGQHA
ncbi:MAG: DUF4381 domain-containing protein [Xanthomonadales bacterium]|nr:DUF4381 domain-containing protein [Xanthomonadales bacterium]